MTRLLRTLRWLADRRRKEADLREELEFHLTEEADEQTAAGLTAEQARAAARRDLGSLALVAEDTAATWGWPRLASSGLLLHSFVTVMGADRGYEVERVMAVDLSLFGERYVAASGRVAFYRGLVERVRAVPGVQAAGAVSDLPAVAASTGASRTVLYESDTSMQRVMLARPVAMIRSVTAGYFAASGTALRAGRLLADDEPSRAWRR